LTLLGTLDRDVFDQVAHIGRLCPGRVLVVLLPEAGEPSLRTSLQFLIAGAGDVIGWTSDGHNARVVAAIASRWALVHQKSRSVEGRRATSV
jgi:hypothetical protein